MRDKIDREQCKRALLRPRVHQGSVFWSDSGFLVSYLPLANARGFRPRMCPGTLSRAKNINFELKQSYTGRTPRRTGTLNNRPPAVVTYR